MAEAQFPINNNINKIVENKIKSLEARMNGPNSTGNLPVEVNNLSCINEIENDIGINVELIKSSIFFLFLEISNNIISGNNTLNNIDENKSLTLGQNSSKLSIGCSGRKKTPPKKAERKVRTSGNYQIDYLTTKIQKPTNINHLNHNLCELSENVSLSLNEEFDKDIDQLKHCGLSFSKLKESQKVMDSFLSKTRERDKDSKDTYPNSLNNSNNKNSNSCNDDNQKLQKDISDLKKLLSDKENEIEKLKFKINDEEETVKKLTLINKSQDQQLQISKLSLIKYLKELEEIKKANKKRWLNEQEYKLGRAVLQRVGQTTIDIWEDGEEIIKLNARMKEIEKEKIELESQRNNLTHYTKKKINQVETAENQDEINNLKELFMFKLTNLQKEESKLREICEKLQIEKTLLITERKRMKEEEGSRFGSSQSKEKYPILSNRYLILGLLGKGGYSEVYKAYDLENNIEVACKIHQLNPQWSDSIKENYIRHTIRENQIHKEINHSKIVKHYDTIEIDNNSFCTVLELCSGPDLHTYLKMYKTLPEKEARAIISQILSGLHYMNKQHRKIIHYDLKPQNIIFHNMEVKISDFGLAKIMDGNSDRLELTSQGVGTYWYLPPECFDTSRNPPGISSKVDIWSLGVILYELVFGSRPFGQNCTQDKILKEGIILNAKQVTFPPKPIVSKLCKVKLYFYF
jgi:tousled-like kinase